MPGIDPIVPEVISFFPDMVGYVEGRCEPEGWETILPEAKFGHAINNLIEQTRLARQLQGYGELDINPIEAGKLVSDFISPQQVYALKMVQEMLRLLDVSNEDMEVLRKYSLKLGLTLAEIGARYYGSDDQEGRSEERSIAIAAALGALSIQFPRIQKEATDLSSLLA